MIGMNYVLVVQIPTNSTSVFTLFDFDPEEIARQLTIIDFSLFVKIRPMELMNQVNNNSCYSDRNSSIIDRCG